MKTIVNFMREYVREEWNAKLFLSAGALLLTCGAINYALVSEISIIRRLPNPLHQFTFYFFFYGIPYATTLATYASITGRKDFLRNKNFLWLSAFCIVLLSAYVTLHNLPLYLLRTAGLLFWLVPHEFQWYTVRCASNLLPGLLILTPLFIYWIKNDRNDSRFYGFSASNINLKTYFCIILLLVPIVLAASYTADFQSAYPRYKFGLPLNIPGGERALIVGLFEACYGVDFVFVELIFRGLMVMALARYLGSASILPMVVVYVLIHFQKPMGEAIGSLVGGFVLGVIAYRTKSIYGGIILHLGIAYLMEIAGAVFQF